MGSPARILLFLYLFSAILPERVPADLVKLPALWQHFTLHRTENPGIGFVRFLKQHYGSAFRQHRSSHDHSKLPGKSEPCAHHCGMCLALGLPAEFSGFVPTGHPILRYRATLFSEKLFFPTSTLSGIWQPPKVC